MHLSLNCYTLTHTDDIILSYHLVVLDNDLQSGAHVGSHLTWFADDPHEVASTPASVPCMSIGFYSMRPSQSNIEFLEAFLDVQLHERVWQTDQILWNEASLLQVSTCKFLGKSSWHYQALQSSHKHPHCVDPRGQFRTDKIMQVPCIIDNAHNSLMRGPAKARPVCRWLLTWAHPACLNEPVHLMYLLGLLLLYSAWLIGLWPWSTFERHIHFLQCHYDCTER